MAEQLAIDAVNQIAESSHGDLHTPAKPLTFKQQLAWDYIRERDGVTADEIGAWLHAHRDRQPHGVDERCDWCARDALSVLRSKAIQPLVKYRLDRELGRLYVVRDAKDRVRPPEPIYEPTEAELQANPFAGLGRSSTDLEEDE